MTGVMIVAKDLDRVKTVESGVYKKLTSQYTELSKAFEMKMLSYDKRRGAVMRLLAKIPLLLFDWGFRYNELPEDMSFVYYRYESGNISSVRLLRKLKKRKPNVKIILEFPTYPIDWSCYTIKRRISGINFRLSCRKLRKYVDRAVAYGDHKEAYGIPTIKTQNGIQVEDIPLRKVAETDGIQIISVSSMQRWHAIERLLKGMGTYYQNGGVREIHLHLVGDGQERTYLQEIVSNLSLSSHVTFHGYLRGKALDDVYNKCNVGLGSLGLFRASPKGRSFSSTLKSREYWARGLPIITAERFPPEVDALADFMYYIPEDDSDVDICQCIDFFDGLYASKSMTEKQAVAMTIRDFVKKNYDSSVVMKPIIQYLLSNAGGCQQ